MSSVFAFAMCYRQLTHCASCMNGFSPKVLGCLSLSALSATALIGIASQPAVLSAAVVEGQVSGWAVVCP